MCTALSFRTADHYFGRTLDIDRSYKEEVCIQPRSFPLTFRQMGKPALQYALMGMATVVAGIPLFYDAANEYGLAMAGLNFPRNAYYAPVTEGKDNIAPFEFIPWILCQCKTVEEAKGLLSRMNLADIAFSEQIPPAPLHWIIADRNEAVVVESMRDGLHIYDDPAGVLTNNPPFGAQMDNLRSYDHLRVDNGEGGFPQDLPEAYYCQGMGGVGLPGDLSSMSRFVRAAFGRRNAVCAPDEAASVGQFFHILGSVEMSRGLCLAADSGQWDVTLYTSCINTDRGLYYYTTYGNRRISCVDLHRVDLSGDTLGRFPLQTAEDICYQT